MDLWEGLGVLVLRFFRGGLGWRWMVVEVLRRVGAGCDWLVVWYVGGRGVLEMRWDREGAMGGGEGLTGGG
jgi:hypothetical protein